MKSGLRQLLTAGIAAVLSLGIIPAAQAQQKKKAPAKKVVTTKKTTTTTTTTTTRVVTPPPPPPPARNERERSKGGAKPAFDKGDKTLGLSLGFGVDYGYYGSVHSLPAIALTYDQGIIGNVGPGTIGIGGIIGFKSSHYNYDYGDYKATWTNFIIGVRGTYHLTILKDKNNKFDPYAGVMVGIRVTSYKDTYYDYLGTDPYTYGNVNPTIGAFVGAKYNFSPHFGAFAELGYDISFFRIGVNANF